MDVLIRIKQLVLRRRIVLTEKVQIEMWADSLDEDDLIESIVNADKIDKTLRSANPFTGKPEQLYVIKGRTFSGQTVLHIDFRKKIDMKLSKPNFIKCPVCRSSRIKRVQTDYVLRMGIKSIRVPRLTRHECPNCGEKFFDYEATKRIESARETQRLPKSA